MLITHLTYSFGHFLSQLRWAKSQTASDFVWNYGSDTLLKGASATYTLVSLQWTYGLVFLIKEEMAAFCNEQYSKKNTMPIYIPLDNQECSTWTAYHRYASIRVPSNSPPNWNPWIKANNKIMNHSVIVMEAKLVLCTYLLANVALVWSLTCVNSSMSQ